MPRTLYVSDLDGTLLRHDETLSPYTARVINCLAEKGVIFSFATARSRITACKVTGDITANIPIVVYNGSFVMEKVSGRHLYANLFADGEAKEILDLLISREIYPIVYSHIDGIEKFSYVPQLESRGMRIFGETRRGDVRERAVSTVERLYDGEIFYFTCIDEEEKLLPVYELLKERFSLISHIDIYSGERWLEILPKGVSKAKAVTELKRILDCDRVVCFGDGVNDISMFETADECYAVGNAHEELKRIATAVIGTNEDDGVARRMAEKYKVLGLKPCNE